MHEVHRAPASRLYLARFTAEAPPGRPGGGAKHFPLPFTSDNGALGVLLLRLRPNDATTQGFGLGDLYLSGLLIINALAVLHEKRFLAKRNSQYHTHLVACASAASLQCVWQMAWRLWTPWT